jgi:AbrB family looped-hinge helix DNA binding protein
MPIASAKVTSKGQITLPAKLREQLGIKPGDRLDFERNSKGGVELVARRTTAADLRGILKTETSLTDEQLDDAINSAFGARWRRFAASESNEDRN